MQLIILAYCLHFQTVTSLPVSLASPEKTTLRNPCRKFLAMPLYTFDCGSEKFYPQLRVVLKYYSISPTLAKLLLKGGIYFVLTHS